jgi:hypothetical protein
VEFTQGYPEPAPEMDTTSLPDKKNIIVFPDPKENPSDNPKPMAAGNNSRTNGVSTIPYPNLADLEEILAKCISMKTSPDPIHPMTGLGIHSASCISHWVGIRM